MAEGNGGTPWIVWAVVTILAALISAGVILKPDSESSSVMLLDTNFPDYSDKVGIYMGESLNKVGYKVGKTVLDLQFIDPESGKVRAYVRWYDGLYGEGSLFGSISDDGLLNLAGTIFSGVTGSFDCELEGSFDESGTIEGTYRCLPKPGNPNGTQDGQFIVKKEIG